MQTHWTCLSTARWNSLICEIVPGRSSLLLNCNWYLMADQTMTEGRCCGQITNAIGAENVNKGMFARKTFCQQILKEDHQQIAVSQQLMILQGPVKIMSDGRWTLYSSSVVLILIVDNHGTADHSSRWLITPLMASRAEWQVLLMTILMRNWRHGLPVTAPYWHSQTWL